MLVYRSWSRICHPMRCKMRAICCSTQLIGMFQSYISIQSSWYPISRIRELLNAFCRDDDEDNHAKLVRRIKNVLSLEALLEQFIKSMGSYTPLEFHSMTNMEGKDSMRSLHSISSVSNYKDQCWIWWFIPCQVQYTSFSCTRRIRCRFETICQESQYTFAILWLCQLVTTFYASS